MLAATRSGHGRDWTDWLAYAYLALGLLVMFGPVLWMVVSSFKTPAALTEFPPRFLPYGQAETKVEGHERPLPLYTVTLPDGTRRVLAEVRRIGIVATMVDPLQPDTELKVNVKDRERARVKLATTTIRRSREVRLRPVPVEQHVHHRHRNARPLLINDGSVRAPSAGRRSSRRLLIMRLMSAHDHPRSQLPVIAKAGPLEQPVGRHLAGRRHPDGRLPAAAVHADDSRRDDRCSADG
jgi:hypothetical protein